MGSQNSLLRRRSSKVFAEDPQQTTPTKTMLVDEAKYFKDHDSGRGKKEGLKRRANSLTPNQHSPSYTRKRSIVFSIEEKPTLPQRTIMSKSATIISPSTGTDNYFKSHNYSRIPSFLESEDFLFRREEASMQSQFADAENDILISKSPSVHSISSVSCSSDSESSTSSCSDDTFSPSNRSSFVPSYVPPLKGNPFSSDNITNLNKSNYQTRRNTMKL